MDTKAYNHLYNQLYYLNHKEIAKARTKAWYRANKERSQEYHKVLRERKRQEIRDKKKTYYAANRESIRAKQNAKNAENPKLAYQRVLAWRKANPEKYKALYTRSMNKRRAFKLITQIGKVDYETIRAKANELCGICKLPIEDKFEYDHIVPLSKGGSHTTENHQLTHPSCNRKKSAKLTIT